MLIVMTDGEHTYFGQNSFNRTDYAAYGYGTEERLGNGADNSSTIAQRMDERLKLTCSNAKKAGVQIYTVAFQITDATTIKMMNECATTPSMAFDAKSNSALVEAFERIAEEITKLRLQK